MSQPDTLQFIAIARLRPSPFNPRKTFRPEALADLTASVQAVGILTPLIARPHPTEADAFELAAGHRRFTVASAIGLPTVPVIVREYSDDDLREVLIIENLQRADVSALEEADALQALIDGGRTVAQAAERIGRDVRFVRRRLALRNLAPVARELLEQDKISLGVAQVLASADHETQARVIEDDLSWNLEQGRAINVGDVVDAITSDSLELAQAPWDLADATLHTPAGACATCPKRTGHQAELLPEMAGDDRCLDATCFDAKRESHSARVVHQLRRNHKRVLEIWHPNSLPATAKKAKDVVRSYGQVSRYGNNEGWYGASEQTPGAIPAVVRDGREAGTVQWLSDRFPGTTAATEDEADDEGGDWQPRAERQARRDDPFARKQAARETRNAAVEAALLAKLPANPLTSPLTLPLLQTLVYFEAPNLAGAADLGEAIRLILAEIVGAVANNLEDVLANDDDLVNVAALLGVDLAPVQAAYDAAIAPPATTPKAKGKKARTGAA